MDIKPLSSATPPVTLATLKVGQIGLTSVGTYYLRVDLGIIRLSDCRFWDAKHLNDDGYTFATTPVQVFEKGTSFEITL